MALVVHKFTSPLSLHSWIRQKDVRKYLYSFLDQDDRIFARFGYLSKCYIDDYATCNWIVSSGHLKLVKWVHTIHNGCQCRVLCETAAFWGQLEMLKWARANGYKWMDTLYQASYNGKLDVLKWARSNGCEWTDFHYIWSCNAAERNGHLEVLQWIKGWGKGNGERGRGAPLYA
jgi:hypothetical protein